MAIEMEVMRPGQIVRAVDATLKNLLNTFANQGFNGRKLFICEVHKGFQNLSRAYFAGSAQRLNEYV